MSTTAAVRVATPEIRLHCGPTGLNEAVLSLDFLRPNAGEAATTDKPLLATGGADKEIKLWRVGESEDTEAKGSVALDFVFSLSGHDRSVNCISSLSDVGRTILSLGHKGDITDLSWSPDSAFLASSSVDNRCVIWNVEKGDVAERRKDHTQYVQGVAWDPLNEFIVTEGNDRTCRVYSLSGFGAATRPNGKKQGRKFMCVQTLKTREFPSNQNKSNASATTSKSDKGDKDTTKKAETEAVSGDAATKAPARPKHRMFLDDTYFLAPTGTFRSSESATPVNTVYAFSRGNLSQPALHLPGQEKASLAVRCSPLLYELRRPDGQAEGSPVPNLFKTEYRSVFAVITLDAVVIYDTQQAHPICTIKGLHYADLTDATWTADGQTLSISSTDGYISFVQFEDGFFGTRVPRKGFFEGADTGKDHHGQTETQPAKRASLNSEGALVRKKRKISPTPVPPVTTTPSTCSGPHASTSTPASSVPKSSSVESAVVDLSGPSPSEPAPAPQAQPAATQPTETHTPAGTFDDPLNI
ncbi:WD40 repeat, conserved site [Phytophthora cactorum]|nr:WD40 repeat, conserved site [Phytophthora cactorum]